VADPGKAVTYLLTYFRAAAPSLSLDLLAAPLTRFRLAAVKSGWRAG